jgi:hypothetical protein
VWQAEHGKPYLRAKAGIAKALPVGKACAGLASANNIARTTKVKMASPASRDRFSKREVSGRNEGIYPPVSGNSIGSCDYGKIEKKSRWWLLQAGASVSERRDSLSQEH